MQIEHLATQHVRNLRNVSLRPRGQFVVLEGHNGQGKTNVLEALYLCATGRSFRHATARQMLQHGEVAGRIEATLTRQGVRHDVRVTLSPRGRSIAVDGRAVRMSTRLLELMNMVAFFPDDLRIIKGAPEERRRFLDRAVANHDVNFAEAAVAYHRVLKQRNALLRQASSPDRGMIEAYNQQLVRYGAMVHESRLRYVAVWVPGAQSHLTHLLSSDAPPTDSAATNLFGITLTTGLSANHVGGDFSAAMAQALQDGYPRDRARGMTLSGPHRADLICTLGDHEARGFASQGQQRAMVLALKLAEVECLRARLQAPPVLLLDDVSSELDHERLARLFEVVQDVQCQVWLTTTGAAALPLPANAHRLTVRQGHVTDAAL